MDQILQLTHPAGKKAVTLDKRKYDALRRRLLDRLRTGGESTHAELPGALIDDIGRNKTGFTGSVEWHMEWVKLDLEAKNEIRPVGVGTPVRFALSEPSQDS